VPCSKATPGKPQLSADQPDLRGTR